MHRKRGGCRQFVWAVLFVNGRHTVLRHGTDHKGFKSICTTFANLLPAKNVKSILDFQNVDDLFVSNIRKGVRAVLNNIMKRILLFFFCFEDI
jgi:hypothetical protein